MKATAGDTHLGGDNVDQRIVEWLVKEFKKDEGLDLRSKGNAMALQRLVATRLKKPKSSSRKRMETEINPPFLTADASGPKHMPTKPSRAKLEQLMVEDLVKKSHRIPGEASSIKDSGVDAAQQINEVVLVGGQTRIPRVKSKTW